jgi:phage-related protein
MTRFKDKHLWVKKANGLGITEFMLGMMAWLCTRDETFDGSQMCIVTGPNIKMATIERNSINAGMSISMTKISKEEAIRAISETVEEIGQPLQNYMSNRQEFKELIDVHRGKELVFDVLIDKVS